MEQEFSKQLKNTTKIGDLGESLACAYLEQQGFNILARNYKKKFGEIDIIARKASKIHFVEVKTVTHETKLSLEWSVTHETWRPEELVHKFKLHQIEKVIETWLAENEWAGDWQVDVLALRIVPRETYANVNYLENVTRD